MQRLTGLGRTWTKLRFCILENPKKPYFGLSLLKPQRRTFMAKTSEVLEKQLRKKDAIPEDFTIVYRGGMDWYIHSSYSIATTCFVMGLWSFYYLLSSDEPLQFPLKSAWDRLIGIKNFSELFILYGSFFAMVLTVRSVSKRYVMRMYFNEKTQTYRAVHPCFIPFATTTHDFKAKTVHRIKAKSIVPWWNFQYKCNGEKLLILDDGFRTSADYDRMFMD